MPRLYTCVDCGARGTKKEHTVVVSAFTGNAYCVDRKACERRSRRAARKAAA